MPPECARKLVVLFLWCEIELVGEKPKFPSRRLDRMCIFIIVESRCSEPFDMAHGVHCGSGGNILVSGLQVASDRSLPPDQEDVLGLIGKGHNMCPSWYPEPVQGGHSDAWS